MHKSDVINQLKEFVVHDYLNEKDDDFDEKTNLLEWGIINSFELTIFLNYIEKQFQVDIPIDKISSDYFVDLDAIADLIITAQQDIPQTIRISEVCYRVVDGIALSLDIVRPSVISKKPFPAIIHIHGGGWSVGDKRFLGHDGQLEAYPNTFLAEQGFFTVSINYRSSQQAPFPAQIEDVKAAVKWLRAHAEHYHLAPDRIGVWGNSAGGHLAALLGTSADVSELEGKCDYNNYSSSVQAVVDLWGATDFTIDWSAIQDESVVRFIKQLFGALPQEVPHLAYLASPLSFIREGAPPFLIAHCEYDEIPIKQSEVLYEALKRKGNDVTLLRIPEKAHDVGGTHFEKLKQQMLRFFSKHLQ